MDPKQTDHQPTIKSDQNLDPLKKDVKDQPTQNRIEQLIKSNAELNKPATPTPTPKLPEAKRAPVRSEQTLALRRILTNYCSDSQMQNKAYEAIIAIFPE